MLERLSSPVTGISAEDSRNWRAPGVHIDDNSEMCDSFSHLELIRPIFIRSDWTRKHRRPAPPTVPCPVFDHFCDMIDYLKTFIGAI